MARVATITDGDLTTNLIETSKIRARSPGGFGPVSFDPAAYDMKAPSDDAQLFLENWQLIAEGTSHDNLTANVRTLIRLLRRAYKYRTSQRYRETHSPVYITNQLTDETGTRYAMVWGCRALEHPDLFGPITTDSDMIVHLGITIARYIWRDTIPGTLPSAVVLTPTEGPATPTRVHIANHRDDVALTHWYLNTTAAGWSANHIAATGVTIPFAVQSDAIWVGSTTGPFSHVVFPALGTSGAITDSTLKLYYSDGVGTIAELTLGTDYTCYPGPTLGDCFEQDTEDIVISILRPNDWVQDVQNVIDAWWIVISDEHADPDWGTDPITGAVTYNQRTPEAQIPDSVLEGDVPPYLLARFYTPAGGDENEGFANLSRIVVGSKEDPGVFVSHLNLGGEDNPANWTESDDTDTTFTADVESPGNSNAVCDFAGDATMVKRVTLTGDGLLSAWVGKYRVFVRAEQKNGNAGDVGIMLRTYIHETATYSPKHDTVTTVSGEENAGLEIFDLGTLRIPFTRKANADVLTDADIIFEIHAEDTAGNATLYLYDLILIPVDKWSVELDDPITDSVNGTSALRGASVLQMDGGVVQLRTGKFIKSGTYLYPAEEWGRGGPSMKCEPETDIHLYFLAMHYTTGGTWGDPPFMGSLGCHIAFELYSHACYEILRGAD